MPLKINVKNLNWKKTEGYIPGIIQHYISGKILMLGYLNKESLKKTIKEKKVTFYSRTKQRLWTKGETSKNYLIVKHMSSDCDQDTILILVKPYGNTCHLNKISCFSNKIEIFSFLFHLEKIIDSKKSKQEKSYTSKLLKLGIQRIAQKVGEEAVETILASMTKKKNDLINEVSDLMYHLLVLLNFKKIQFKEIIHNLQTRNTKKN
ncbi:Histidine biosynthesis bifunctional protein HisIE [Buchnera aphidicola (Anoecia corni)]|uniref:Histidine biosynthesis bifunctional protein HisIE n=1 Tax=Buchnera aphidicola (Anoecia corni) TaxID=2994477 RepID=A0AAT9IG27_9GAMM